MENVDLIIGYGQIGKAVGNYFVSDLHDPKKGHTAKGKDYRIMHVAIPFTESFVETVLDYQEEFNPRYTVIHSTVPVGTSRRCDAVHSPVVGMHPNLAPSLKIFKKFIGGEKASDVADFFRRVGIKVYTTDKSETTELMKALCTTNYGLNIEFTKEVKRLCEKYEVPFEMFTLWNNNYNEGYEKLGYPEYHRYNLVPLMKQIGGHCILPNYNFIESKFTEFLKCLKEKE